MLNISHFVHRAQAFLPSLRLRSRTCDHRKPVDSPLAITEILWMRPGEIETYHLPLTGGTVLDVEVDAESPLEIRLLDEKSWRAAGTPEARLSSRCCQFVVSTKIAQLQFVAPHSCAYMLLICNAAVTKNYALLTLSSELPLRSNNAVECDNPADSSILNDASPTFAAIARLFSFRA